MGAIWAGVKENRRVGEGVYRLTLAAPAIAQQARPGQFVMLKVTHGSDPLLARPFSIHGAAGDELLILYKVVGRGTRVLSQVRSGKTLQLWGPLGRGYNLDVERPMLVAGGMGRASLDFAAKELSRRRDYIPYLHAENDSDKVRKIIEGVEIYFDPIKIVTNIDDIPDGLLEMDLESSGPITSDQEIAKRLNVNPHTTICFPTSITGGYGGKGFASDYLNSVITKAPVLAKSIMTCGPMPMLKAVAKVCAQHGLACQVSLEAPMACGLGACLGCAIPAAAGGYLRACQEGPVLDAQAVDWERI